MSGDPRRRIPSVDRVLECAGMAGLRQRASHDRLRRIVQEVQDEVRAALANGAMPSGFEEPEWYAAPTEARLAREERPSLRRVINATGVVLHTNLGRAPLPDAAREALDRLSRGYSNLEYELGDGRRGSRYSHCVGLLRELTGAEDALVVNNNAAAVVLALNTLSRGREAVVSRGELVEIGGSFRVSEIMARSGVVLREVGATNRTHRSDYEAAIGAETGMIVKVHRSNFRMSGFTSDVPAAELVGVARGRGVPLLHDLGSGLLLDPERAGLPPEPTVRQAVADGADVVTLSGDKLLGGPQAGIVLGRNELVERMRRNPLCRALRVDKLTLAALEATLALYREPEHAVAAIPTLRMLASNGATLRGRASTLASRLRERAARVEVQLLEGSSAVGGGAYPDIELATTLVALRVDHLGPDAFLACLREQDPPVVARIQEDRVVLDCRTIQPGEEDAVIEAVSRASAP